jgi:hypothetical protein
MHLRDEISVNSGGRLQSFPGFSREESVAQKSGYIHRKIVDILQIYDKLKR